MPIYEYRCRSCEADFEELVRSAEAEKSVKCPECGGRKVDRRLSVFAARETAPCGQTSSASPCSRCGDGQGSCGL
jgi:putative FmdB family regulatory protein